ncbi:MAG: hypothetical protein KKB22_06355, partial [Candidatus Omnitrophica bacterium]|nr:hypothetical protein [Candidatus Omnitrophota bacterium]
LTVVIVIGVLTAIGVSYLMNAFEKSKAADAREGLNYIYRAEIAYYGFRGGVYTNSIDELGDDVVLTKRYWNFSVNTPTAATFTAIATRASGSHSGETITLDDQTNLSGNWEFR